MGSEKYIRKIYLKNLEEENYLEDIDVNGTIIFKCVQEK
jgi:hypothetical protein